LSGFESFASRTVWALSLLAAGILAAPASAATVTATDDVEYDTRYGTYDTRSVQYTGAPGEANRVVIESFERYGVRIRDSAGITTQAPCRAEDAQTVVCPRHGSMSLGVSLGGGDDTLSGRTETVPRVDAGDGNDVVDLPSASSFPIVDGGPGDDTLTAGTVKGGSGADVLKGNALDYGDHTESVTIDLAGGPAGAAGEGDRVLPGASEVSAGSGPDLIRAAGTPTTVYGGAGDDIIDGSPERDYIVGAEGNDTIRGADGDDFVVGDVGNDRLEGVSGDDVLYGFHGDDVLDGGPGRDELSGHAGADQLLARDGERDEVECQGSNGRSSLYDGDRATIDTVDADSWCTHVTGARRLVFHGFKPAGVREARIIVSCERWRACRARVWVDSGRVVSRVRVPAGKRKSILVRRIGDPGVKARLTTTSDGVLEATFFGIRRR